MTCRQRMAHVVVIAEVAALVFAAPALAQDCPELVGRLPGPIEAVAISGDHAYLGTARGLLIADVSDPSAARLVGEVRFWGENPVSVAVSGAYAYVVTSGMLWVIDVRAPSAPVKVGYLGLGWYTTGVAVSGGYLFVAGRNEWPSALGNLWVIDVSTPSAPLEVGFVYTRGPAAGIAVEGGYAYVTTLGDSPAREGLSVFDVSAPSAPVEAGFINTPADPADLAIAGGHAYVALGDEYSPLGGLWVVDVSTPSAPVEVGFVDTPGHAFDVAVSGGYAYVAAGDSGLRVVAVGTPSAPVEVGFVDTPFAYGVAVSGGHTYVADWEAGLRVIDVTTPSAPVEVGFVGTLARAIGVAVSGGNAYVADRAGLRVLDVSTPAVPVEVGFAETPGFSSGVAVSGDYAYVTYWYHDSGAGGLRVFDVSTPSAPVEVGFVVTQARAIDVAVSGGHAYVATFGHAPGEGGLSVIDVSTPSAPFEVGFAETPGSASDVDVAVSRGYAYVADWEAGLRVIDVSTPSAPVEVGFAETPGSNAVAASGGTAYIAHGYEYEGGLRVIDVSTPSAPVEVAFVSTPGPAWGVAVSGRYGYLGEYASDETGGYLRVIDVATPSAPVEVGLVDTQDGAVDVTVSGEHVFFATEYAGLYIFSECGLFPDAHESFIPAAAVAAGAEGAFFQTDVEINNRGALQAEAYFEWLPRGHDNSAPIRSATFSLGPGESRRFENALATLFELGPDSLGALKLVASTESVIGMSRTYNAPEGGAGGTFGQGLPAVRATEMLTGTEPQRIIFLSESPDFRANVGCVNGSSEPARINIRAFDDQGSVLGTRTMDLAPYSNQQMNRVFSGSLSTNGYVDVWADSDDALYYCYGSLLDNRTSDPTTILPEAPLAGTIFIPAAALATGLAGSFFETDLDLNNAGRRDITYELLWLPRGADNRDPIHSRTFSLAPGAGVRYANVLNEVFGLEPDQFGALAIEASGIELLAMSRTYNLPPVITAGTFGQGLPAVRETVLIGSGERKRIIFMNENAEARSNVGCQNGSQETVRVFIELFSPEGESLEIKTMDLQPLSNNQITKVFRDYSPISAGYVDVWTNAPGASIYCYGSVLDNFTSDPTTVLPQ